MAKHQLGRAYKTMVDAIHANHDKYGKETCIFRRARRVFGPWPPYGAFKQLFGSPNGIQAKLRFARGRAFYATAIDAQRLQLDGSGGPPARVQQWARLSLQLRRQLPYHGGRATRADKHIIVDPRQTNLARGDI